MSQFLYLVLSLAVNRVAEAASGSARNLSGIPCGQPGGGSPFRQGRIMGGTAADIFEFPYAVSLRNNVNEHYCAGSLVSLFFSSCMSYFLVPHSIWKSLKKVSFYKIASEGSYGYSTTEATNPTSQSWPIFQFVNFQHVSFETLETNLKYFSLEWFSSTVNLDLSPNWQEKTLN